MSFRLPNSSGLLDTRPANSLPNKLSLAPFRAAETLFLSPNSANFGVLGSDKILSAPNARVLSKSKFNSLPRPVLAKISEIITFLAALPDALFIEEVKDSSTELATAGSIIPLTILTSTGALS